VASVPLLWACGAILGLPSSVREETGDAQADAGKGGDGRSVDAEPVLTHVGDYCLGYGFACAIVGDAGSVACWGSLCGDAGIQPRPEIVIDAGAISLSCGLAHACALVKPSPSDTQELYCWGSNETEAVTGTDSNACFSTPQESPQQRPPLLKGAYPLHVATGAGFTCAAYQYILNGHGNPVYCWGAQGGGVTTPPPALAAGDGDLSVKAMIAGFGHACVNVTGPDAGGIYCWGSDQDNCLGGPTEAGELFTPATEPVALLAAGNIITCYEPADGSIECVGKIGGGDFGTVACGDGGLLGPSFVPFTPGFPIDGLGLGSGWFCALSGGTIQCSGDNSSCQVGYHAEGPCLPLLDANTNIEMTFPPGATPPEAIRVSALATCFIGDADLDTPGYAPGYPEREECVAGRSCSNHRDLKGFPWVSAFACARASSDRGEKMLYCWGSNSRGELGRGEGGEATPFPEPVTAIGP